MIRDYINGMKVYALGKRHGYSFKGLVCNNQFYCNIIESIRNREYPVTIHRSCMMGDIEVGGGSRFWDCEVVALSKVMIGMGTAMNYVKIRQGCNPVLIGNYCSIGEGTRIIEYNHRISRLSSSYYKSNIFKESIINDIESKGAIEIQDDVWIGNNCMILSGVHVGRGAVIGAGSIVTKDIEPYTINGGNPCHRIKERFAQDIIADIEGTKWWEYNPRELRDKRNLFEQFEKRIENQYITG